MRIKKLLATILTAAITVVSVMPTAIVSAEEPMHVFFTNVTDTDTYSPTLLSSPI